MQPQLQQDHTTVVNLGRRQVPRNPGLRAASRSVLFTSCGICNNQCSSTAQPSLCSFQILCSTAAQMTIVGKWQLVAVAGQGRHFDQTLHLLACRHESFVAAEDTVIEHLPSPIV